ncbi:MAG: SHOCT domain-containing protein, partial [Bacteroidota bacterium]
NRWYPRGRRTTMPYLMCNGWATAIVLSPEAVTKQSLLPIHCTSNMALLCACHVDTSDCLVGNSESNIKTPPSSSPESGEAIVLGHFSDGRPVPGRFAIEAGRNIDAPFGFFAIYNATGARALATGGTVTLDATGRTLSGSFDLVFDGDVSIVGAFTATPDDEGGRGDEEGDRGEDDEDRGEEDGDRGEDEEDPGDEDRDNTECDRLLEELRALYEAGEITREEVAERFEAAGCGEGEDPREEGEDPREEDEDPREEDEDPREEGEDPREEDEDPREEGEDPREEDEDPREEDEDRP